MARGKKKNRGKLDHDNDDHNDKDDDDFVDPIAAAAAGGGADGGGKKKMGLTTTTTKEPHQQHAVTHNNKKNKKKNKGRHHDDDEDDDDFVDPIQQAAAMKDEEEEEEEDAPQQQQQQSRKQKRMAKLEAKRGKQVSLHDDDDNQDKQEEGEEEDDDDEEDDEEEEDSVPIALKGKKNTKKKKKGGSSGGWKQKLQEMEEDDDDDEDDEDEDDKDIDIEEKDDDNEEEEDDDDDEEVEQVAVMLDDWGMDDDKKSKKKKHHDDNDDNEEEDEKKAKKAAKKAKKEAKKEKKEKKRDKKKHKEQHDEKHHDDDDEEKEEKEDDTTTHVHEDESDEDDDHDDDNKDDNYKEQEQQNKQQQQDMTLVDGTGTATTTTTTRVKSKFELQMEAALQKKQVEEQQQEEKEGGGKNGNKKNKNKKSSASVLAPPPQEQQEELSQNDNEQEKEDNKDEEPVQMYGIGDGTTTSTGHTTTTTNNNNNDMDDLLLYGSDGKKLSNKERKKLLKAKQAAEREAIYNETIIQASRDGAQFACSQTIVNEENDLQWQNSLHVNIPNFSISAAGKILFQDATLQITHGRRYGLIGPNGKGKSTLLKMIASNNLKLPPRIDYLYVEQEIVADDTSAVQAVLRADVKRWQLLQEETELQQQIDQEEEDEEQQEQDNNKDGSTTTSSSLKTLERLQVVMNELSNMGADAAEAKARRILYGLGFTIDMQTKPTKMFSGGWRMRISLARALFVEPTLLMLDEPTNHLDLNAVIWLEEYLKKWKKTLFVVSHDQDFLNSVCEEILHIEDLKLISYKGNYDSFKKAERIKFEQQQKAWEKQEKRLRELKKSGQSKQKAQETMKKTTNKREAGARSQKKKNQAVATGTEAVEVTELIQRPREYHVKFEFSDVVELTRPVMEVNRVHFRYSPKHPIIFDLVDFGIDMDSRITIVGPNGAGKSTLLKLLTGEVNPTKGEVKRNPRLRMGIYNQHFVDKLPMDKTPVEFLRDRFQDEDYQSVRNRLGKYGLEGHAHEVAMRDLSGGQKARVVFVELSLQRPHILLLDEPTNNLDIESIDALCDAINEFNGGVVVVTHDQRLIDECDCTLWVVEKLGVTEWTEGFDDYKSSILEELEREVERENQLRREKLAAAATVRAEKLARLLAKNKQAAAATKK